MQTPSSYKEAGVDIDLATELLGRVKPRLAAARRPEMLAPIGGFGGLFQAGFPGYREPVLVASIDGVGTKLMVAAEMQKYDTVGFDIVNHCINDIAVQGAEPIYFLDYIGIGKLRSPLYEQVLGGIADACRAANCAVLGGETAEMPGMYGNDFDLVGIITGIVEKSEIITGEHIAPGDVAIGLASNGLHTNGFSLARKLLFDAGGYTVKSTPDILGGESVGEALLKPHVCYLPAIKAAKAAGVAINGIAHITGGGLIDNVPRILPKTVDAVFHTAKIPFRPPVFDLLVQLGNLPVQEAYRVFNMGVGMVWFVRPGDVETAIKAAKDAGIAAFVCGEIVEGAGKSIVTE